MKKLQSYLSKKNYISESMLNKSERLKQVSQAYRAFVDQSCSQHCIPVDLAHSTLVFTCKSALWANKLKLLSESIIAHITDNSVKHHQLPINKLKIRIDPSYFSGANKYSPMEALSTSSIQSLKYLATSVKHDKLKASLQKLATSGQKNRNKP